MVSPKAADVSPLKPRDDAPAKKSDDGDADAKKVAADAKATSDAPPTTKPVGVILVFLLPTGVPCTLFFNGPFPASFSLFSSFLDSN